MNHNPDIDEPHKTCALCGLQKTTNQFNHDGRTRDRLTYRCYSCLTLTLNGVLSEDQIAETAANRNDHADTFTTTHQIPGDM